MGRNDNPAPGVQEQWVAVLLRVLIAGLTAWLG
jgi:hypothetical protein